MSTVVLFIINFVVHKVEYLRLIVLTEIKLKYIVLYIFIVWCEFVMLVTKITKNYFK